MAQSQNGSTMIPDSLGDYPRHARWWIPPVIAFFFLAFMVWADWRQFHVWRTDDERTAADHGSQALFLLGSVIIDAAMACGVWATSVYPITSAKGAGKIRIGVYVCLVLQLVVYWLLCLMLGVSLFPKPMAVP